MGAVIPKLRASARGQMCTLRTCICNHDPDTTVLAHLPSPIAGTGTKSDDWHAVFACSACHDAMDRHSHVETNWRAAQLRALQETQQFWFENGYLVVPGVLNTRAKPSKKIVQRTSLYVRGELLRPGRNREGD